MFVLSPGFFVLLSPAQSGLLPDQHIEFKGDYSPESFPIPGTKDKPWDGRIRFGSQAPFYDSFDVAPLRRCETLEVKSSSTSEGAAPPRKRTESFEWRQREQVFHTPAPMKSMTGHGWAEHASDGHKVSVEISSVNRKQSEVTVVLPRELEVLEAQTRDEVNRRVARGRVSVRVTRHVMDGGESQRVALDVPLARQYAREFKKLARELHLSEELTLDTLLRAPGVMQASQEVEDAEAFWPAVSAALTQALDTLVGMREREGKHLAKDLNARIRTMRQAVARVKKLAPQVQVRYRQTLLDRIRAAGLEAPQVDADRIQKEVIYFADRSDVSEELTRLEAHFAQYDTVAKSGEPVGRTLDFLAQEMNREINTLGAKANDSQISADVVMLKTELEKFREQVQNVE